MRGRRTSRTVLSGNIVRVPSSVCSEEVHGKGSLTRLSRLSYRLRTLRQSLNPPKLEDRWNGPVPGDSTQVEPSELLDDQSV